MEFLKRLWINLNTIRIPGVGNAESLNVSVATGIVLNELGKINPQK